MCTGELHPEKVVIVTIQGLEIEKTLQFTDVNLIKKASVIRRELISLFPVHTGQLDCGSGRGLGSVKLRGFWHIDQKLQLFIQFEVKVVTSYKVHNYGGSKFFVHPLCCILCIFSDGFVLALDFVLDLNSQGSVNLVELIVCHFCVPP